MTLEEVVGRDYTLVGSGRYLKTLEHSSLVVDTQKQIFYWNSKHLIGDLSLWFRKVKGQDVTPTKQSIFDENYIEKDPSVIVPDASLINIFWKNVNNSTYWLDYRHYTQKTIDKFRLGFTGEWNTIPIYEHDHFVNFQCRTNEPTKKMKHWYKGLGPHTFNFSILPLLRDYVVITESPVDTIMLDQYDIPAVSQTSGAGSTKLFLKNITQFLHLKRIFIVYDNDKAGKEGAEKLGELFGEASRIFTFEGFREKYDVTDFFKENHSRDDFCNLLGI